jgi:hypothetical protein
MVEREELDEGRPIPPHTHMSRSPSLFESNRDTMETLREISLYTREPYRSREPLPIHPKHTAIVAVQVEGVDT